MAAIRDVFLPDRVGYSGHHSRPGRSKCQSSLGATNDLPFRFEPQLLSHRLPVKVYVLRADLIALNLSERSQRIGDGATGRRGAIH